MMAAFWTDVRIAARSNGADGWVESGKKGTSAKVPADPITSRRFDAVFASTPVGMAIVACDGEILSTNGPLRDLWGADPVGMHLDDLVCSEDLATEHEQLARLIGGDLSAITLDLHLRTAPGHSVPATLSICLVRDERGRPSEYVVQVVDVSEPSRLREMVRYEADHDSLTGLLNRRAFARLLDHHVAYARRYRREGALLVLDIDGLRQINLAYGVAAGDTVLEAVAASIAERVRETDVVGRIGGDEIAVMLPEIDADGARRLAAELVRGASERAVEIAGLRGPLHLTVSAAIVLFGDETVAGDVLFTDADAALEEAKAAGHGHSVLSGRVPGGMRRSWADKVRAALETDAFMLDAQAIVDAETGEAVMHELLLRMRDDDGAIVRPAVFLEAAERYGLMRAVDEWVVRRAIALVTERPMTVTVNLSGDSVGDPTFLPVIVAALLEAPESGEHIVFEITERVAVGDLEQAKLLIARLGEFGCRFALDDFGAGVGGFQYLKHLPVEFLKLDGEFTRTLPSSREDHEIVAAIVHAAAGLGKTVIAECVEDEEILAELRGFGIPLVQGIHVGRPEPSAALFAAA
jgi:diguanylate cyclase (GGDEF)-like protein/PAS domain S-box-containing protein